MATQPLHIVYPRNGHPHTHTVIFLHGRDSTNEEFAGEFFESEASEPLVAGQPRTLQALFPTVRWVFPAAPILRSARFDTDMSQWFDIWSVEDPTEQAEIQHEGLRSSVQAILAVVRSEAARLEAHGRGPGRQSLFLAGISQGFATAVAAFFAGATDNTTRGIAGLIGLCSWMPLGGKEALLQALSDGNDTSDGAAALELGDASLSTPILLCHSSDDDVVPVQNGRALRDILGHSLEVEWHEYVDGGHWVNEPQGVDDIASFLRRHM